MNATTPWRGQHLRKGGTPRPAEFLARIGATTKQEGQIRRRERGKSPAGKAARRKSGG